MSDVTKEDIQSKADEVFNKFKDRVDATDAEVKTVKESLDYVKEQAEKASANEEALKAEQEKVNKMQEQLDALETANKGIGGQEENSVRKQIDEQKEGLEKWAKGNGGGDVSFKLDKSLGRQKADMYTSNNTVNDVIEPDRLPGVYADPLRSVHVRDFMNTTTTGSDVIYFIQETAYTDGAGTVTDPNAAGDTDFTLTQQSAPVQTINTFLNVHKNMLNDADFLEGFIRTRVPNKLLNEEDDQILYGDGSAPNLNGITNQAQAYTDLLGDSNVNRFQVLANAVTNARVDEFQANRILVHPEDYFKMLAATDTDGRPLVPNIYSGSQITVNGIPVVQNTAVTKGDFIVGDFAMGGTFAIRQDIEITMSMSHSDNLKKGFVAMLIEERAALPIYRSDAFVYGDFATALAEGSA